MSFLDKNPESNIILSIMFNLLLSKLFFEKEDVEQSKAYKQQALLLIEKNNLKNNPLLND